MLDNLFLFSLQNYFQNKKRQVWFTGHIVFTWWKWSNLQSDAILWIALHEKKQGVWGCSPYLSTNRAQGLSLTHLFHFSLNLHLYPEVHHKFFFVLFHICHGTWTCFPAWLFCLMWQKTYLYMGLFIFVTAYMWLVGLYTNKIDLIWFVYTDR